MIFSGFEVFVEGEAKLSPCADGLAVEGRKERYSSLAMHVSFPQGGRNAFCVRLKRGAEPIRLSLVHKLRFENDGQETTEYDIGTAQTVTDSAWTWITGTYCALPELLDATAYFYQDAGAPFEDVLVREITSEALTPFTRPDEPISRQPFTVGAIRWDAYFSTDNTVSNVSCQVARSLSPAHFRGRAPFFSQVRDGKIVFPQETQEQFDREAEKAIEAGIDYFAYCWYRDSDPMSYARKQHLQSKYRDRIQMAAIVHVSRIDDETLASLASQTGEDCYLKFDGRPVIFVFQALKTDEAYRQRITDAVHAAGQKTPYYIGMHASAHPYSLYKLKNEGFDAIGAYGFSSSGPGESYASFARRNEEMCRMRFTMQGVIDHVPILAMGHDFRPRIEHPVSWMGGSYFAYPGTPEEVYTHAKAILSMAHEQKESRPNTVLVYAWNEHDEGGWICPTLEEASDNYPAFKKAVREVKQGGET